MRRVGVPEIHSTIQLFTDHNFDEQVLYCSAICGYLTEMGFERKDGHKTHSLEVFERHLTCGNNTMIYHANDTMSKDSTAEAAWQECVCRSHAYTLMYLVNADLNQNVKMPLLLETEIDRTEELYHGSWNFFTDVTL